MLYFDFLSLKNKEQSEVGLIEVKYKLNRNNNFYLQLNQNPELNNSYQ